MSAPKAADLQFCNCGSFVTCRPVSERGEEWLDMNVADDARPLLIEVRYLGDIVLGARAEGLVCHG